MDFRDSALVLTACLALAFATLLAGALGFAYYRSRQQAQTARYEAQLVAQQAEALRRSSQSGDRDMAVGRTFAERARAAARIEELKRMLDQKNMLLESKAAQLNKTVANYEALRVEMNESFANMLSLVSSTPEGTPTESLDPETPPTPPPSAPSEAEIEAARQELMDWQQNQELLQVRELLLETTDELTRLQQEADQEILLLTNEIVRLRGLAADALIRVGPPAIPVLTSYLQSEDPGVRQWAAEMLGEFGPTAEEALPTLRSLNSDPEPVVREAVEQAIRAIRP